MAIPAGTVADIVLSWARQAPAATAIATPGGARISFATLAERADSVARVLTRRGIPVGQAVAVMLPRGADQIAALLGVMRSGAAYVPVDPALPPRRVAAMLRDAGARTVITARAWGAAVDGLGLDVIDVAAALRFTDDAQPFTPPVIPPLSLAYVLFTSGSTGTPKGVMVTHEGFSSYVAYAVRTYRAGDGAGAPVDSPIGFDLTVTSLFAPLVAGRAVTLVPEASGLARIESLAGLLSGSPGYSLLKLTPSTLASLRPVIAPEEMAGAVRALVIGGEQLTYEMLADWRQAVPGTRIINEYGPTETVVGCCVYEVAPGDAGRGPVPIGVPVANAVVSVVGAGGVPAAVGGSGELWVGGAGVARGYAGRPGLTAERFVPRRGGRWYRTGDVVRVGAGGVLSFSGRMDAQVKVRGMRVEPGEVDAVLAGCAGVSGVVTLVREDVPGDRRLTSYVTLAAGFSLGVDEVAEFARERLPEFLVPSSVVVLDAFPLTRNGKVDHGALPAPGSARPALSRAYTPPRTPAEEFVAALFADVLGIDKVGVDDDFFALGGHSLLVPRVTARVREDLGVRMTLRQLFDTPTAAATAAVLETLLDQEAQASASPVVTSAQETRA